MPLRILIVRLTALGDVIHGMPVACALRDALPDAHIGWVVEGGAGDILEGHPAIDELIRVPRRWFKSPRAIRDLRKILRAQQFDVAIDLQGLTKSAFVAWLSGAPRRLGPDGSDGRELSRWLNNERTLVDANHVVDHYLGILKPLEIDRPRVRFDLPENIEDAQFADALIARSGLTVGRFAVLNPGAGWPSKLWPASRYGQLSVHLERQWGIVSLAVWGGDEKRLGEEIVTNSQKTCQLSPPTRLRQLAAVIRRASLFVGSDTGPMQLAAAVKTPTISLHGTSEADRTGAFGPQNERLQAYYHDGPCHKRRKAPNTAMRAITVEMVAAACDRILERSSLGMVG